MMKRFKQVKAIFTGEDYETLKQAKGDQTWEEFILTLVKSKRQ